MNLRHRVDKLLEQVRGRARQRASRPRYLKGMTFEESFDQIERAFLPGSEAIVEELGRQAEEYAALPPHEFQGVSTPRTHAFIEWISYVQEGHAPLPSPIPHALLLAYRNGHANHPCKPLGTPIPTVLCQDCEMVLPNSKEEGGLPWISPCPACGGTNLAHFLGLHRDPRLAWYFGPQACAAK
jgi:hypothetical protein